MAASLELNITWLDGIGSELQVDRWNFFEFLFPIYLVDFTTGITEADIDVLGSVLMLYVPPSVVTVTVMVPCSSVR